MTEAEMRRELAYLARMIKAAAKKATAQAALVDKLSAAQLKVELLMKKLRRGT